MKNNYQIRTVPRMFEQVASQIVDYIHAQNLTPGSKLPTERGLSEQLAVSRSSIREGIRVLELLRFLESKQGEGTFVATPPPFIFPRLVLKQTLPHSSLDHYFEIAWLSAEAIVTTALQQELRLMQITELTEDWRGLDTLIVQLGGQLDNTYYLFLWSDIHAALHANGYFTTRILPFVLSQFITAYQQQNHEQIRNYMQQLKLPIKSTDQTRRS
jgi:GntR family transcriptional repressor for pyruvate dehydrogenase complex